MNQPQQPPPPGGPYAPQYAHPPKKSGMPMWVIALIAIPIILVFFGGVCAAIAIPALTKYMRRSKTSEARVQIAKMFDAAATYHAESGDCPTDGNPAGTAGLTPPRGVACGQGPGGRCVPGGPGGGGYPAEFWSESAVWQKLKFQQDVGHYFHYDFRWSRTEAGCQFTAQAFGDLDDDGIFSTFERSGAADVNGVNAAAGLYIDNEME